jgi:hypothetical protein
VFPLQNGISTADEALADLQRTESEGFVSLGFMEVVTQFAIDGTDEVEE